MVVVVLEEIMAVEAQILEEVKAQILEATMVVQSVKVAIVLEPRELVTVLMVKAMAKGLLVKLLFLMVDLALLILLLIMIMIMVLITLFRVLHSYVLII